MPIAASIVRERYQKQLASGNDAEFFRLLNEADERLLMAGRWHWVRRPLTLVVSDNRVTLPAGYESVVGARVNGVAVGANWEESEWFEGGPGEFIPIDGASVFLVDQGLVEDDPQDPDSDVTTSSRVYKLTSASEDITEVEVLARYASVSIDCDESVLRCPTASALKQMMYSIIYEEANDTKLSEEYRAKAIRELNDHEAAYRGIAKRVFKPSLSRPVRRSSRTNFP